jgi:mono/diheme cytochrome c family protein
MSRSSGSISGRRKRLASSSERSAVGRSAGPLSSRAANVANPTRATSETLVQGLEHYRENCVGCHGAPHGIQPGELAKGMQPKPPALDDSSAQLMSDAQLFWITRDGIRFTGMPAFGPTHDDAEIWTLVTFVRHLPLLTEREASKLRGERPQSFHHHHEDDGR